MATTKVTLTEATWTLVSAVDCYFENIGNSDVYVSVATSTAITDYKIAKRLTCYDFDVVGSGEKLYAYSPDNDGTIAYDPK